MNFLQLFVPFFQVVYVVLAVIMIGLILMQRGAGAQAGSSFGAGASGTVFGAQGSANFMSRATAVCATLFFVISFGMGVYLSHGGKPKANGAAPSIMDSYQAPVAEKPLAPAPVSGEVPVPVAPGSTPAVEVPAPVTTTPAPAATAPILEVPAAPTTSTAPANPQPNAATPAPQQ
jgi:preprotein translocase subunit SecG